MNLIQNQEYFIERPLYALKDAKVINCFFSSAKDGESAFKEAKDYEIDSCTFSMRYPIWHSKNFRVTNTTFDDLSRAGIWYCKDGHINKVTINGVKYLRESSNIKFEECTINSEEFGWRSKNVSINKCELHGPYVLFESSDIEMSNVTMSGKYSYQYTKNLHMNSCTLDTKDAFWHSEDAVIENCTIKGEYLGWYSKNLVLRNCKIIGTQPLCYCKNLKIINCEFINADLAFEYSEVNGNIIGSMISIKNGKSGTITLDSVDEIILSDSIMSTNLVIKQRNK